MTAEPWITAAGPGYRVEFGDPDRAVLEFDFLRTDRGDVTAELSTTSTAPAIGGLVHVARVNLLSTRSMAEYAGELVKRTNGIGTDWRTIVAIAGREVVNRYRAGAPAVRLADAVRPPDAGHVLPPLLVGRMPTILYGDGGSGKSLIALAAGLSLQTGTPLLGLTPATTTRVALLDWEMTDWEHRERAVALTGAESDLLYIPCSRPLADDVERIRRILARHEITYILVDSVALACDGPPEAAEVAVRFFGALRQIGLGSLCIAHTTKAENGDAKPFGSAFFHNGARLTWLAKKQQDVGGTLTVGLFCKKANTGPLAAPMGFAIDWQDGAIAIRRTDVRDVPNLADHVSLKYRLRAELATGARTIIQLADDVDAKPDSIRKALERGLRDGVFHRFPGPDGIDRWGLAA